MEAAKIVELETTMIIPGPNDRTQFDQKALEELAASIRDHGLAQPITVRPIIRDRALRYEIVAGERRFRAISQVLGQPTITAIIQELTDQESAAIMLAENVSRADLNPIDEAQAYQKRMRRFGWSVSETAQQATVSKGRVKSRLALLSLRPEVQKLAGDGHLPLGLAEEMSCLDVNRQLIAIRWIQQQAGVPTRRAFAEVVGKLFQEQSQDSLFDLDGLFSPMVVQAAEEKKHIGQLLPSRADLPALNPSAKTIGAILDSYLADLLTQGHPEEASVVSDLFSKLAGLNRARVNLFDSKTLRQHPSFVSPVPSHVFQGE